MARRKKAGGLQLELPLGDVLPGKAAGGETWDGVEAFPGKVLRHTKERKKLVRKKMHQVDVEQLLGLRPHTIVVDDLLDLEPRLTQQQADALDELVVFSPD